MYWSCGIEVYHNNDEDYVKVDYRQDAYEEEEDEMEERGEKKMEVDKNQTIQLNQINDFIRDIHNNDVDLSLNEDKKQLLYHIILRNGVK